MLNKAILVGRLTADPELKQTPSGVSVCGFTIAANRNFKDKGGNYQADFIDCVAWRDRAEFIAKYFRKGNAIAIDGSIQTRTYTDKNDNKRKAVEVIAEHVSFVEGKSSGSNNNGSTGRAGSSVNVDDFEEILDDSQLPF